MNNPSAPLKKERHAERDGWLGLEKQPMGCFSPPLWGEKFGIFKQQKIKEKELIYLQRKIIALLTLIAVMIGMFPISTFAMTDAGYTYLYVAPNGNDDAEGTIDAPLASMEGAKMKIREIKNAGTLGKKGAVIYFREGSYSITKGVRFTGEDSGTADAPIVYRSYPGEKATFVAGAAMNPKDFYQVTDKSILDRIVDEGARSQIVAINLRQQGLENVGEVYLDGAYSYIAPLPSAPAAKSVEFFVDGKIMLNSRYPNEGYMKVSKVVKDGYAQQGLPGAEGTGDPFAGIEIALDDMRYLNWSQAEDAAIFGFWYYDWADQSMIIENINLGAKTLITDRSSLYGTKTDQRCFVYNLLEEIDIPGEYYIDRKNGVLYLYPPKPVNEIENVNLSLLEEYVVQTNGDASHIEFKDMKFTAMRKGAFYLDKCKDIRVIGCEIEYTADHAVRTLNDARDCIIKSCYIHDVNGGISLASGEYDYLVPGNCVAENNHIERYSRLSKTYTSAIGCSRVGNIARYNEIHDAPHLALSFSGQDQRFEYNEVYDVVQEADDAAAIYGGQSWVGRGLQIRYNYVHDIKSKSGQGVGRAAVYLDGGQCDVTMVGNVVENIEGSGFWVNGGQDNNVYNNIAINVSDGAVYLSDIMTSGIIPLQTMLDRVVSFPWTDRASEPWKNEVWRERYPEMVPQLESGEDALKPLNNMMKNNLIVNSPATKFHGSAQSYLRQENNYVADGDPGFVDMANRNYLLKEDSEVFDEIPGFHLVPFTRMGRYDDRAFHRVKGSVVLQIGSPFARSMDKDVRIDTDNLSVVPFIENDYTMVPLRFLSEAFGADVKYDNDTKKITIANGADTLELTVDSLDAKKNGEDVKLAKEAKISGGRTLIPLRNVAELLGKEVYWFENGLIVVSNDKELFSDKSDAEIIDYLHEHLTIH